MLPMPTHPLAQSKWVLAHVKDATSEGNLAEAMSRSGYLLGIHSAEGIENDVVNPKLKPHNPLAKGMGACMQSKARTLTPESLMDQRCLTMLHILQQCWQQ